MPAADPPPQPPPPQPPPPQPQPPLPPEELRALVGVTDPAFWENPDGGPAVPELGERGAGSVLDFGCGAGRLARRFILQQPQPQRYLGIDLHAGMIRWCAEHLTPAAPQFEFLHHDVYNSGFNPAAAGRLALPFPAPDASFDAVVAHSVFTHIVERAARHYLGECARVLRPGGALVATWFLFDKAAFPMMHPFQNALYVNIDDPTNAVIYDRTWLRTAAADAGLVITSATPPAIRGFHWTIVLEPAASAGEEVELPEDTAPLGSMPPPVLSSEQVFATLRR